MRYSKYKMKDKSILQFQPSYNQMGETSQGDPIKKPLAIYVHIPYCNRKCLYCSIDVQLCFSQQQFEQYIQALVHEIQYYRNVFQTRNIRCIHFGGGTPSIMSEQQIERVINAFRSVVNGWENIEIVFEAHPLSLSTTKLELLSSYENVSLSLGIQTFNTDILSKINRNHNGEYIIKLLEKISLMSFRSLGIDLIANLPNATIDTTLSDIEIVERLGIKHLALYPLRVEPNSIFYNQYDIYEHSFLDCDVQQQTIETAYECLENLGFSHYSIFHFDKESMGNFLYMRMQMQGEEWIGLGAGAYSFFGDQILVNETNIDSYMHKCFSNALCVEKAIQLNKYEVIRREFVYSFRNRNITKKEYIKKYGRVLYESFEKIWKDLIVKDFAVDKGDCFTLTTLGIVNLLEIEKMIDEQCHI